MRSKYFYFQDSTTGLHYCIGKVLGFRDDGSEGEAALEWFERGAQSGCIHSKLEQWRKTHRQQVSILVSKKSLAIYVLTVLFDCKYNPPEYLHASLIVCAKLYTS